MRCNNPTGSDRCSVREIDDQQKRGRFFSYSRALIRVLTEMLWDTRAMNSIVRVLFALDGSVIKDVDVVVGVERPLSLIQLESKKATFLFSFPGSKESMRLADRYRNPKTSTKTDPS